MSDAPPPPPPPGFGDQPPPPPYGAPGYGYVPPYGAPGYGYGPQPIAREHPSGTTVLVLGILGLVLGFACCIGFVLSPIAWAKGHSARREIAASPGVNWSNQGAVTAGWVCGIIGTVIMALAVVLVLVFVAVGVSTDP